MITYGEVRDLEIKEMSLEEKYDKLYDSYILTDVIAMAFIKENGLTDEYLNYTMKVYKKMMPSIMSYAFKFIKTLSPGRTFKMFVSGFENWGVSTLAFSNSHNRRL